MSKKLEKTKPVAEPQEQPVQQQPQDDAMLAQSMAALEQQEQAEREAYESGNVSAMYGVDSYQQPLQDINPESSRLDTNQSLPDVDPAVTAQQERDAAGSSYTNVFASVFYKLSTVFGEDSAIGSKLKGIADNLQGTYGEDAGDVQQEAMQERMSRGDSDSVDYHAEGVYEPDAKTQSEWQAQGDLSNQNMAENAKTLVDSDEFVKLADAKDKDFDRMASGMTVMHQQLGGEAMVKLGGMDFGPEQKADVANNYMTMMRGLKSYNDTALSGIEEKYADDPEKLELARKGLGNVMNNAVGKAQAMVAGDNHTFDCLSEKDVQELDSMQFQGVDKTYSQYVAENRLQPRHDESLYANAESISVPVPSEPKKTGILQSVPMIDSRMAGKGGTSPKPVDLSVRKSRTEMAENAFSTVLANEQAEKQASVSDGMER